MDLLIQDCDQNFNKRFEKLRNLKLDLSQNILILQMNKRKQHLKRKMEIQIKILVCELLLFTSPICPLFLHCYE